MKAGATVFIGFMIVGFIIGAIFWPYAINTCLEYLGKDTSVNWWQGGLIGFVPWIGHLAIPAAVVTWIAMLFLG